MQHRIILLDFVAPIFSKQQKSSHHTDEENYESSLKKRKVNPEEQSQLKESNQPCLDHLESLSRKLNTKIPVAFSTNFEFVTTKGKKKTAEEMTAPLDVKISYKHEIILVSDSVNKRLLVFELHTGEFKFACYPERAPWQFVIEENYDGNKNEALICSTGNNYLKYDLLELLNSKQKKQAKSIWKTKFDEFNCLQCCAIKYSNSGNNLYCCNSSTDTIAVYSCADGSLVRNITTAISYEDPKAPLEYTFARPVGIDYNFNAGAHEFVLAMMGDGVYYIRESPDGTWVLRKELVPEVDVEVFGVVKKKAVLVMPCAALIDRNNHNVIICSYGTSSMAVYGSDGKFLKTFGSRGSILHNKFMDQTSCCINELTGSLLIVDSHNNRVQIYK